MLLHRYAHKYDDLFSEKEPKSLQKLCLIGDIHALKEIHFAHMKFDRISQASKIKRKLILPNNQIFSPLSVRSRREDGKGSKNVNEKSIINNVDYLGNGSKNGKEAIDFFNAPQLPLQIQTQPQPQPQPQKTYKFTIKTQSDSLIKFPGNEYKTDDKDLKTLVDLMNEKPTKEMGYSQVIDEKMAKIYKRHSEGTDVILIKCIAHIPFPKDIIFEAIANLDIRKSWDSVFSELKVVNHNGENGAEILYMIIKSPVFLVEDRDFVQQRKMWRNFPSQNSHILHFISVESADCPRKKKLTRAETIISGYYILDDPEREGESILGILSQTDIKGSIPVWLVNKFAPKSSKGWVKSLLKGCQSTMDKIKSGQISLQY